MMMMMMIYYYNYYYYYYKCCLNTFDEAVQTLSTARRQTILTYISENRLRSIILAALATSSLAVNNAWTASSNVTPSSSSPSKSFSSSSSPRVDSLLAVGVAPATNKPSVGGGDDVSVAAAAAAVAAAGDVGGETALYGCSSVGGTEATGRRGWGGGRFGVPGSVNSGDARPGGVTHPARQTVHNNININNVIINDVIVLKF